ncbi:MAG: response regulator [Candidatus Aceula lacicola]|nr:response regulator [Candidatus Aceula lacicola]
MLNEEIFKAKILIIDDQKLHIGLLEDILRKSGYANIESTTDPQEGIEFYKDKKPDLILLDLDMPKIDGFSVIEQLKEIADGERLPLLALSPDRGQDICLKALEAGATDFIAKPYEGIEVLVRIRNIIEAQFLNNQVRDQNKILEEKVKDRTRELTDTRLDIIRRLARAAECRDEDTGTHIVRMSKLCVKLGQAVGLDSHQSELLLNASPLHDIGKIGIPDSVLLKPGKLDTSEWEIMKSHTTLAAQLLTGSDSELMKMGETIALTHHEKWDGSGYPVGLKGEEIPLVGRIVAICDVFDALLSKRPYKKAWAIDDAVAEIGYASGKHFDPELVEFFLEIIKNDREAIEKDYQCEREE